MKVITKVVDIQNRKFVLIQMEEKDVIEGNAKFIAGKYGTISYELIDEQGKLKRSVNGLELCLADTIAYAIDIRNDEINCEKFADLDEEERTQSIINYYKNKLEGAR